MKKTHTQRERERQTDRQTEMHNGPMPVTVMNAESRTTPNWFSTVHVYMPSSCLNAPSHTHTHTHTHLYTHWLKIKCHTVIFAIATRISGIKPLCVTFIMLPHYRVEYEQAHYSKSRFILVIRKMSLLYLLVFC